MAFHITDDHDTIRSWIESHGGKPAVVRGLPADRSIDALSIQFDDNPDLEEISWDEFFDALQTNNLSLRYSDAMRKGDESASFNFVGRNETAEDTAHGPLLPEDNEMARENMFPSEPSGDIFGIEGDPDPAQH